MIAFKQYLLEVFDVAYPFKRTKVDKFYNNVYFHFYAFEAGDEEYMAKLIEIKDKKILEVVFKTRNGDMRMTNTRQTPTKIFTTVIKIVEEFYSKHKNFKIKFTASLSEPSRVKMYSKMAGTLARKFNKEFHTSMGSTTVEYTIQ